MLTNEDPGSLGGRPSLGTWSLVAALLAIVGVIMVSIATFTSPGSSLEPAEWLRMVTIPLLPLGAPTSVALGMVALRRGSGRRSAVVGLALTAFAVGAFVVTILTVDS